MNINSEFFTINSKDWHEKQQSAVARVILQGIDGGPLVVNVDCQGWHSYLPKISGWHTPIEDMEPYLPREEFKQNMIIDPLIGWEDNYYG